MFSRPGIINNFFLLLFLFLDLKSKESDEVEEPITNLLRIFEAEWHYKFV